MGLRGPGAKPVKVARKPGAKAGGSRPVRRKRGQDRAGRVIAFVESLQITAGVHAGRPFRLREWQKDIVRAIYGEADGRRMVRTALITMPRKNGKSGLAAALCLAHLVGPEAEPRGQVYSAAADRNQAALLFAEMKAFVLADPALAERVIIREFTKEIEDAETGSIYRALSADAKTKHGFSASFICYDELAQAPNRLLYDVLATSGAARAEPLMVVISTQSSDPNHIMCELTDYGGKVNAGVIADPSFHATIYSAPEDADPWDEATWHACNPALGDFRSLDEMRTYAAQAQRIPAREATFRQLYLNQQIDAVAGFINRADWQACAGAVDPRALYGRPCWGGLDLSSTTDLTALVLYFPEDGGALLPFYWVPGEALDKRELTDRVPYRLWRDKGHIEATNGRAIDKRAVARRLAEIASSYDVRGIAYDRWRIEDLRRIMADEGIALPLCDWGQGYKDMGPAVDALEAAILDCRIMHGGHPVLAWNAANARIEIDPTGARKLSKARSIERIDGLVALAMALGLHGRQPPPKELTFGAMVLSAG